MEKFVVSNGCALRIADTENGDVAVMLLHGYLESLDVFDEFTWLLADRVRVVEMDIPGHGVSEVKGEVHSMEFLADTLVGVLDKLGIEKIVLVGHSMGGYVAMETLKRYPQRVAGIVLMHSRPDADTPQRLQERMSQIEFIAAGKKMLLTKSVPDRLFALENVGKFRDVQQEMAEQIYLTEDEGIMALLRGMAQRDDYNEVLRKSSVKQLFIFGRGDRIISSEAAESAQKNNPQAETVWFEHSGHAAFIEEPQACADAIVSFAFAAVGK